ncbi:hypothetical protein FDP41_002851 [Naegleria fowleri]|uniref:Uncharacterized protein n=1 Tax=Naegleria fowleri TaxID=5763 RepID=A0A6A5BT24_NAEFO|nr:uncharacterized protein FDP41_002851 [Naegleria fowleri]KAF0978336.1 hypothetical protein FDP41_002851 [Naegleria fowleri]CAG4708630.1 unnamed protein product [Naegleria fowleri]
MPHHHHHPFHHRRRPLGVISSGVALVVIGTILVIISVIIGALYAACIAVSANTSTSCSGITTPIVLGVVGIVLIVSGIASIIGGIRMFILIKNVASDVAKDEMSSVVPVATTTVMTTTVQPQGNYQPQPTPIYYNNVQQPQPMYGYQPYPNNVVMVGQPQFQPQQPQISYSPYVQQQQPTTNVYPAQPYAPPTYDAQMQPYSSDSKV